MCTHGGDHPYVGNWWPDAHLIGYEHGFVNQAYDILKVLGAKSRPCRSPISRTPIRPSACWKPP